MESLENPRGSKAPPGYLRFSASGSALRCASAPAMATNSCGANTSSASYMVCSMTQMSNNHAVAGTHGTSAASRITRWHRCW